MLNYIKNILFPTSLRKDPVDVDRKLQIATCALFIEMARADSNFSKEEEEQILYIMKSFFSLEEEYVTELIEYAEADLKTSISLYEFTTILDKSLSREEKYQLMKNMWHLIYLDQKLDKYEDQLVKRIGGMLNMDFPEIIGAKLEVKKEIGRKEGEK